MSNLRNLGKQNQNVNRSVKFQASRGAKMEEEKNEYKFIKYKKGKKEKKKQHRKSETKMNQSLRL